MHLTIGTCGPRSERPSDAARPLGRASGEAFPDPAHPQLAPQDGTWYQTPKTHADGPRGRELTLATGAASDPGEGADSRPDIRSDRARYLELKLNLGNEVCARPALLLRSERCQRCFAEQPGGTKLPVETSTQNDGTTSAAEIPLGDTSHSGHGSMARPHKPTLGIRGAPHDECYRCDSDNPAGILHWNPRDASTKYCCGPTLELSYDVSWRAKVHPARDAGSLRQRRRWRGLRRRPQRLACGA
jgi:hypothetical protein